MTDDHPALFQPETVLTIAQRVYGAPWRLSLAHARQSHLLIWVTRGAARAFVEGRNLSMGSHNALFIPAGTLFSFSYESTCFGQTVQLPALPELHWPERPMLLRVREPKAQLELTGYVEAIQTEAVAAAGFSDDAISAYIQLMLVWAHRYQSRTSGNTPPRKTTAAQRLMQAFCALVVQSEREGDSGSNMADFAAQLGVTPTHLTRVSKAECGVSAADLITQHTLQRARRMLESTAYPASTIAARLGFSSAAYFTRFVKTHTGQTPSEIRKSASNASLTPPN